MKQTTQSKIIYIVLFGFFASPFLLAGLLAGVIWISLQAGWLWAEKIGSLEDHK